MTGSQDVGPGPLWTSTGVRSGIIHLLAYGQSLSVGTVSRPALTTSPSPYGLKFSHGVRYEDGLREGSIHSGLVPFTECDAPTPDEDGSTYGETPLGGCLQMIAELLKAENGIDLESTGQQLLASAPGHKGETASQLSQGGRYFPRIAFDFSYGALLAAGAGQRYVPAGMLYIQGEADYGAGTEVAVYAARVRQLRMDAQAIAAAVSENSAPFLMVLCQTATHLHYGRPNPTIAHSQLALASDAHIAMCCPTYFLPYADPQHLSNIGSKWLGAYFGLAFKRWLWDGRKPEPLQVAWPPVRMGSHLILRISIADNRKLVLDASLPGVAEHLGFALAKPDGSPLPLSGVVQVGRDTIRVSAGAAIPDDCRLRYGWTGDADKGLGGVRDDAGDALVFDPSGIKRPMHNWLPICEVRLP